jgi:cytosine/adenosine deaminase-related metal-dependent hydrolase
VTDDEVVAFWQRLGLPGLIDLHVHFMPERVERKVWAYFDRARLPDGEPWTIAYREEHTARLDRLRAFGVLAFPSLVYPHKPAMAEWLNAWALGFAAATPDCIPTATFYPEPGVDRYVAEALDAGARIFKVHLSVGAYDPRDPLLVPVWRRLAAERLPIITHAGSGPDPGPFTGPESFAEVLADHPDLVALIAHMGGPEYAEFFDLALRYENVHLDTTMTFTDFMARLSGVAYPPALVDRLGEHPDRVVYGTDFPNIPYPYGTQLAALERLGLGDDWLRAVCYENAARLLGLSRQE